MLITIITLNDMIYDSRLENFSQAAIEQLYEYFDEYDEIVYDPVAIRCYFNEETPDEIRENYKNIEEIKNSKDNDSLLDAINYYSYGWILENGKILYHTF